VLKHDVIHVFLLAVYEVKDGFQDPREFELHECTFEHLRDASHKPLSVTQEFRAIVANHGSFVVVAFHNWHHTRIRIVGTFRGFFHLAFLHWRRFDILWLKSVPMFAATIDRVRFRTSFQI